METDNKPKPESLSSKFIKANKGQWFPMPRFFQTIVNPNPSLAAFGRLWLALWTQTIAKEKSLGITTIPTSIRVLKDLCAVGMGDVSRLLAAFEECGFITYYRSSLDDKRKGSRDKSLLTVNQDHFFYQSDALAHAVDEVLDDENHSGDRFLNEAFAKRVKQSFDAYVKAKRG
jgi:hypothetical protein